MVEVYKAIGRIRRAMPRNADVMLVCDELETRLTNPVMATMTEGKIEEIKHVVESCPVCERRRRNQRNLMRKRRKEKS